MGWAGAILGSRDISADIAKYNFRHLNDFPTALERCFNQFNDI